MINNSLPGQSANHWRHLKSTTQFIVLFIASALLWACSDDESLLNYAHGSNVVASSGEVTVFDKGLNMPVATYTMPSGWKLVHDIAMDQNTGRYTRYILDKYGPEGELIRAMQPVHYSQGRSGFEQAWKQAASQALQDVNVQNSSQPVSNGPLVNKLSQNQTFMQGFRKAGGQQLLEVDFQASRNSKSYVGKVLIGVLPTGQNSGVLQMAIIMSPPGMLMQTVDMDMKIQKNVRKNPQYTQAMQQINQNVLQGMQTRHKQKMAANQQQFDSHQQMMQGRYNSAYQQNEQWMNNNLRNGGNRGGGNGYTGHDATIDGIYDRETFYDPSTGQNVSRDGNYNYNYTDGQGNFYGTDNPNNPPAGWQQTEPLRPNN